MPKLRKAKGLDELFGPAAEVAPSFGRAEDKIAYNKHFTDIATKQKENLRKYINELNKPTKKQKGFYETQIDRIDDALKQHVLTITTADWGQNVSIPGSAEVEQIAYGFCRLGGVRTFHTTDQGEEGEFYHTFITYLGHSIDRVTDIFLDGTKIPFPEENVDGDGRKYFGFSSGSEWGGVVFASVNSRGAADQAADPHLVSQSALLFPGLWTSDHRQRGHAGAYFIWFYDPRRFPNGAPEVALEGQWKNDIYDPRDESTGWTDNAALCFANYLCDTKFGPGFSLAEHFDMENLAEAADICDELVDLAGGGTEKRYTVNGAFFASKGYTHQNVIDDLKRAMGGSAVLRKSGKWFLYPGKWRPPTRTLSEKNLRSGVDLQIKPSKRDVFNTVRGKFRGAATLWELTDYPTVKNTTYRTQDGEELSISVDFPFTPSAAACQRLGKILLEDARQWTLLQASWDMAAYDLTSGDTVNIELERFGYSPKIFQVIEASLDLNTSSDSGPVLEVSLVLKETAEGIYDWNDGEETTIDLAPNTTLPDPSFVRTPTGLQLSTGTETLDIRSDGTVFSRIKLVWNPTTDIYVRSGGQHEIQIKKSAEDENSWRTAGFVSGTENSFWILDVQDGTQYDVRLLAFTTFGKSAWLLETNFLAVGKLENPSTVTNFIARPTGRGIEFSWDPIPDVDVAAYEIRLGAWGDGTRIILTGGTSALWETQQAGVYDFFLRAKDTSKNYSFASATASLTIAAPGPALNLEGTAIFNMIKLTWDPPASSSFPISGYNIYRGTVFGSAILLGFVQATIKTIQEQLAGLHTFWVEPVDIHGNKGVAVGVPVNIASLPFFKLLYDQVLNPDDALTLTNVAVDNGLLVAPVDTTKSYEDVDTDAVTPQDQIDDGYPLWIHPVVVASPAVYEQKIDYGEVIPASLISFVYQETWKDGSGTVVPQVSYSEDDVSYTDAPGEQFVFGTEFRYVKVRLDIEGDDDTSVVEIAFPRLRLEVKKEDETVVVSALASDVGGTLVPFTKPFIDIFEDSVQVSAKSSIPVITGWTISGNDVYVYAWNTSEVRVNAELSVTVGGVIPQ